MVVFKIIALDLLVIRHCRVNCMNVLFSLRKVGLGTNYESIIFLAQSRFGDKVGIMNNTSSQSVSSYNMLLFAFS